MSSDAETMQDAVVFSAEEMTALIALVQAVRRDGYEADVDPQTSRLLQAHPEGLRSLVERGAMIVERGEGFLDPYIVWLIDATTDPVATLRVRTRSVAGSRGDAFVGSSAGVFIHITEGREAFQLSVGDPRDLPKRIEEAVLSDDDRETPSTVYEIEVDDIAVGSAVPTGITVVELQSDRMEADALEVDASAFAVARSSYVGIPPPTWTEVGWPKFRESVREVGGAIGLR